VAEDILVVTPHQRPLLKLRALAVRESTLEVLARSLDQVVGHFQLHLTLVLHRPTTLQTSDGCLKELQDLQHPRVSEL
jgi:hypothetical protein